MAKTRKTVYFCQNCGYESAKWMGQCPGCNEWNTFVEETVSPLSAGKNGKRSQGLAKPKGLSEIDLSEDERKSSGMGELTAFWEAELSRDLWSWLEETLE